MTRVGAPATAADAAGARNNEGPSLPSQGIRRRPRNRHFLVPGGVSGQHAGVTIRRSRSDPWPGNQGSELVGPVAVGAATGPDHKPRDWPPEL